MDSEPPEHQNQWEILKVSIPPELSKFKDFRFSAKYGRAILFNSKLIGGLKFGYIEPPGFSRENERALLARGKLGVAYSLFDKATKTTITPFFSIIREGFPTGNLNNPIWYLDMPDFWKPGEESFGFSTTYLKRGLPWLMYDLDRLNENASMVTTLGQNLSVIETRLEEYKKLLDCSPGEQLLQEFLETNGFLFSFLSPKQIFFKPPILTFYKADFGVVNSNNELILIEIEKAHTPLFTKNGNVHSKLEQAFKQVRDWIYEVNKDLMSAIRCIKNCSNNITNVRGMVIAGRSRSNYAKNIEKWRAIHKNSDLSFYTFDELGQMSLATYKASLNFAQ